MKEETKNFVKHLLSLIISTIISALFCLNADVFFGNLGHLETQIQLADEARLTNEYSESIKWYSDIAEKDTVYAPYAHLALAEIYSLELRNKHYDEALEEYRYAIEGNENSEILNSAMNFILQQITLSKNAPGSLYVDVLSDSNIDFVIAVMNGLNECDPTIFESLSIEFPVDKNDVQEILSSEKTYTIAHYKWEYVSTITSCDNGLAYTDESNKVVLVESWTETTDPYSFTLVSIYKYYRYQKIQTGSYTIGSIELIQQRLDKQAPVLLQELYFE